MHVPVDRALVYPVRLAMATAAAPLAREPFDRSLLLVAPGALFMLLLFVYPFLYGLWLSFTPKEGGALANYAHFFTTDNLWPTIWTTLRLALPATLINVGLALPIAFKMRDQDALPALRHDDPRRADHARHRADRRRHADLFRPRRAGSSQFLQFFHLYEGAIRLTHNYTGVLISLVISGFPFAFLLILSYITGIDPGLARAAATLGADPKAQFRHIYLPLLAPGLAMCFCLAFVQAFSVFPSAVLLGSPAGPTRVISIAAYEAAFEVYDYSLASAIAMIMGVVQLVIVVAVLGLRNLFYRGPVVGGKG